MEDQRFAPGAADDRLRLGALLTARLCHDLSGLVGSLMGVIELAAEDDDGSAEALAEAGDVAAVLARRLRLYRAAWGGATPAMSVGDFHTLADIQHGRRIGLNTSALHAGGRFSPAAARLALNVTLLAADSLPAGGTISFAGDACGDVVVRIDGAGAGWPPRLATYLVDETRAWQALRKTDGYDVSRHLQAPLTALIARADGLRLSFLMSGGSAAPPPLLLGLAAP